jgi:hypothetical protein
MFTAFAGFGLGELAGADIEVGIKYRFPLTSFVLPVGVA